MARKWDVNVIWPTAKVGKYPQIYVQREMDNRNRMVKIAFHMDGINGWGVRISKRQARMLARRLMQALEYK